VQSISWLITGAHCVPCEVQPEPLYTTYDIFNLSFFASHRGGQVSSPEQLMWGLWWTIGNGAGFLRVIRFSHISNVVSALFSPSFAKLLFRGRQMGEALRRSYRINVLSLIGDDRERTLLTLFLNLLSLIYRWFYRTVIQSPFSL
jgi:hypothetical protein